MRLDNVSELYEKSYLSAMIPIICLASLIIYCNYDSGWIYI